MEKIRKSENDVIKGIFLCEVGSSREIERNYFTSFLIN